MIDLIIKQIMANIAQYTPLFDISTIATNCDLQSNTITITGTDGEYVVSGGVDNGTASKGCVNGIHTFDAGVVVTDCFFGDAVTNIDCVLHQVNVGEALKRDFALEMVVDVKTQNTIIVYWQSTQNTKDGYNYTISEDARTELMQKFGVMAKIKASDMKALGGCGVLDKVIMNSVIETGDEDATLIRFDGIKDRFFAGDDFVVDIGFSYLENMDINDIILDRLKAFDATIDMSSDIS